MSAIWLTVKEFLTSKKFITAVVGIIITAAAKHNLNLDEQQVYGVVAVIVAYILGQGWADSGKEAAKVKATADFAAAGDIPPQEVKDKLI